MRERERERYEEGATHSVWGRLASRGDTRERETQRRIRNPKSSQLWLLRLGRMRVLGCGVSSPPDKRQLSSVNSIRNTVANGGQLVGAGNDSPARTFLVSAGSFAGGSGRIAEDGRFPWCLTTATATTAVSSGARRFLRSTCFFTLGNSRGRSHYFRETSGRASGTWSLQFER